MKSRLKIPREQLREGLKQTILTSVTTSLTFDHMDVAAAVLWADEHQYNYADLGDLLRDWALDGSPGAHGPDVEDTHYDFYGTV